MLQRQAELDALGWETDLDRAIRRIHMTHPSSVIVAAQDAETDCGPALTRLQTECPGVQIVEINLETRMVRIFGGGDQILQELRDLLAAVEKRSSARGSRLPADEETS